MRFINHIKQTLEIIFFCINIFNAFSAASVARLVVPVYTKTNLSRKFFKLFDDRLTGVTCDVPSLSIITLLKPP